MLCFGPYFEKGLSKEGRFVRQIDRIENVLEAFECWKRNKKFPFHLWWRYAEQTITEPALIEFLTEIEKEKLKIEKEAKKKKRKSNKKNE